MTIMNLTGNISSSIKRLISLYVADARLGIAKRLTLLMSSLATGLIIMLLIAAIVIFGSLAAAFELRQVMNPVAAYGIIAGFYVLLLVVVLIFKRQLIINPLARVLSRAILKEKE